MVNEFVCRAKNRKIGETGECVEFMQGDLYAISKQKMNCFLAFNYLTHFCVYFSVYLK